MPSVHLGISVKGASNNINYVSGGMDGAWRLNNSALQTKQAALDVCADVLHRSANDYATTTTTRTNEPVNRWARMRNILTSDYAAVLGGFTVTDLESASSTVTVDGTTFTYGNPELFCDAVLRMSGNLDARAALHRVKG